jgi:hypothetical protein
MAMTPRENMQRSIHFQEPERMPMYFGRFGVDDTVDVFDFFVKDANGVDPWGITWVVHPDIPSIGIPKEHPVQTLDDLGTVVAPNPRVFAGYVRDSLPASGSTSSIIAAWTRSSRT